MSEEYLETPVCPECGIQAPDDWDEDVDVAMDYYWQGWQTGDETIIRCRPCDKFYRIVCRMAAPNFRSVRIEEKG